MPKPARRITAEDIVAPDRYAAERKARRREVVALKQCRRMAVGPYVTVHFECFETMLAQVQEMLYIEKGGDEQLAEELAAYNPMIPQGRELTATIMFEIEDAFRRGRVLSRLGGVEETIALKIGDHEVKAVSEDDVERTKADGKTSSVHFLHFPLDEAAAAAFKDPAVPALVVFGHPDYAHMAQIPAEVRASLIGDLA